MHEALNNFWYAVEHAAALATAPRQVTLLGNKYVLYRDGSGQPHAALDRCPHRGASFKNGWVESDCLRCPYHGWSFDLKGHCVHIPVDQPGVPIPALARLEMLPVHEASGFIWIFPGDPAKADVSLIPDFPEFNAPGWRAVSGEYAWDANFSRVVESGLDTSHAPFVHKTFFSNRDDAAVHPLDVKDQSGSVSCMVTMKPPKPLGVFKYVLKKKRNLPTTWLTCFLPNVNRMDVDFGMKGYRFVYMGSNIPVSSTRTVTKWIEVRNFIRQPIGDRQFIKDTVNTYNEDRALVETQDQHFSWESGQKELLLASDQLILAYRKRMAALIPRA